MKDKILREEVVAELAFDPSVDAACLGVEVEDGVVVLSGYVPNYAQKALARAAVERVRGVREVVEHLAVSLPEPAAHADDDLARRALTLLDLNVLVPTGRVLVRVERAWLTLTGEVEWNFQRLAAVDDLRKLRGVRGISDRIAVSPKVSAADIPRHIDHALRRSAKARTLHVTVTAEAGRVRLDGEAPTWADRRAVEDAAWAVPGVRAVDDRIRVSAD